MGIASKEFLTIDNNLDLKEVVSTHKTDISLKPLANEGNDLQLANFPVEERISYEQFLKSGFIAGEKWENTHSINAKINKVEKNIIYCDCLMDKEKKVFKLKVFDAILFAHLSKPLNKKLVLIKIRTKKGASRIDVYDGKGMIDDALFSLKEDWDSLKGAGLDKPLKL